MRSIRQILVSEPRRAGETPVLDLVIAVENAGRSSWEVPVTVDDVEIVCAVDVDGSLVLTGVDGRRWVDVIVGVDRSPAAAFEAMVDTLELSVPALTLENRVVALLDSLIAVAA